MRQLFKTGVASLGLMLLSDVSHAAEYCTKENFERDRAFMDNATSSGWLAKGPEGVRDSILIKEGEWYKMNYLQQIKIKVPHVETPYFVRPQPTVGSESIQ